MKSIFIHAGLHKTGTTSVQAMARKNHKLLKTMGVYYPPLGKFYGNLDGGLHSIPRDVEAQLAGRTHKLRRAGSLSRLISEFESSGLDKLLISSEGFSRFNDAEIAFLANLLRDYEVTPILVFRHPISYRISRICSRGSVKVAGPRIYSFQGKRQFAFGTQAKLWKRHFPTALFFKYESHQDITKPIFDRITGGRSDSLVQEKRRRESLPVDLAMLHHDLRGTFQIDDDLYRKRIYNNLVVMQDHPDYKSRRDGIGERLLPFEMEQQVEILSSLREEIAALASLIGESCEDYLIPLEGHIVRKKHLDELKTIFVRMFLPDKGPLRL